MPPIRQFPRAALVVLSLAAAACDLVDDPPVGCTEVFAYGINVTVQDSLSGVPAASGAHLTVRDDTYVETATVPTGAPDPDTWVLHAAGERPGIYTLTVEKGGFLTWERRDVVVPMDEDRCHVVSAHLVARLRRAP